MNPFPVRDIEILQRMVQNLEAFKKKLNEDIPHHEKQIIQAAIVELKAYIVITTRDIKRRLRERCDY